MAMHHRHDGEENDEEDQADHTPEQPLPTYLPPQHQRDTIEQPQKEDLPFLISLHSLIEREHRSFQTINLDKSRNRNSER